MRRLDFSLLMTKYTMYQFIVSQSVLGCHSPVQVLMDSRYSGGINQGRLPASGRPCLQKAKKCGTPSDDQLEELSGRALQRMHGGRCGQTSHCSSHAYVDLLHTTTKLCNSQECWRALQILESAGKRCTMVKCEESRMAHLSCLKSLKHEIDV